MGVGIVVVSHSALLARGVVELAREMGGPEVPIEGVGGLAEPGGALGTDAVAVHGAIERIWSGDGVLVLVDLGSAVLSAESALDLLSSEQRERVVLCSGPLVEGAVAAAAAARAGEPLPRVAEEALSGLRPKAEQIGDRPSDPGSSVAAIPVTAVPGVGAGLSGSWRDPGLREGGAAEPPAPDVGERAAEAAHAAGSGTPSGPGGGSAGMRTLRLTITNQFGLHARPTAHLIEAVRRFEATVTIANLTAGRGPASARSLTDIATLGVRQGEEVQVTAWGAEAAEALRAVEDLAARNFGDPEGSPAPPEPRASVAPPHHVPPGEALEGLSVSAGIAIGPARRWSLQALDPPAHDHGDPRQPADPRAEEARLTRALQAVGRELRGARERIGAVGAGQEADILSAHLLLLQDEELLGMVRRSIAGGRMDAAAAWSLAAESLKARFDQIEDPYLKGRAEDVAGIARRVTEHLTGAVSRPSLEGPGILVAAGLSPMEASALDPARVHGIATASGGPASHAALLVRSLGIPAVMGLGDGVLAIEEGTAVLLDADAGRLHLRPSNELVRRGRHRMAARVSEQERARSRAQAPTVTLDGCRLEVHANIGGPEAVVPALAAGAGGVGLLRTEFLFLGREDLPDEQEQEAAYRQIAEALGGRPLVLRTLDVGGDKPMAALGNVAEKNPFLGLRGIRQGLARPEVLATQVRAALRVAARHPVKVMFPLVSTMDEYRAAVGILDRERERLAEEGLSPCEGFEVGVMVEVPSLALIADSFASGVGFFSIGTNDLSQYVLAADRENAQVAALADPLHPSVLRLVRQVTQAARSHGRWVGVCGEAASDRMAVPLFLGLGVSELSVAPVAIPAVKDLIRELDAGSARALVEAALDLESAGEVRRLVSEHLAHGGLRRHPRAGSGGTS